MTDEGSSSPSGSNRGQRVRHRDVWNQQIKESNERTKTQIKSGFKVGFQKQYVCLDPCSLGQ